MPKLSLYLHMQPAKLRAYYLVIRSLEGVHMALDHYVSQVHLKNFYAPELGERMYGTHKKNLKTFPCDALSQYRIEEGSTNRGA